MVFTSVPADMAGLASGLVTDIDTVLLQYSAGPE